MKRTNSTLLVGLLLFGAVLGQAQSPDSAKILFTEKGSRLTSLAGSLSHQTQENRESVTAIELGFSFAGFATDNIAPGVDWKVTRFSLGSKAITQMGFGPKFIAAFSVPEVPVYPYFGFGYNLVLTWQGDDTGLGHLLKVGLGVIVEPVEHLGIPLEFTINFPVGEDSDFKIYGFSIGFAVLGY